MYLVLSPFFYYLANEAYINNYITLESNGELPYNIPSDKLQSLVDDYLTLNSHGVDENKKDKYITYICEHISQK